MEGFTSQEDQELLSRIEKQLKRRFAIGSQVSEHSIIQDFTKQVGLPGPGPTRPALSCTQQAGLGWGRGGCSWAQACPQCSPLVTFSVTLRGEDWGLRFCWDLPGSPSPLSLPSLPCLPFVGLGEAEPEGEPSSLLGTELLIP